MIIIPRTRKMLLSAGKQKVMLSQAIACKWGLRGKAGGGGGEGDPERQEPCCM